MCDYDRALSHRLQRSGNTLVEQLEVRSGKEGWDARQFAQDVCRAAFGTALDPEAYAKLDDDRTRALLPQVEAAHASPEALDAFLRQYGF